MTIIRASLVFPKNANALDAIKTGNADVAFTNASAERARDNFTEPYRARSGDGGGGQIRIAGRGRRGGKITTDDHR